MDLKTTITVNSQAKLDAIQKTTQELNKASAATQLLTKAQELLGKQLGAVNNFTESYVLELQDVIEMAKAIPDLLRDIGTEQQRVNNLWQSFANSNTVPSFAEFTETAKELAKNINDTSKATGIAVNDMAKLATFASKNGLEFDTLNDLLVTLAQNLGEVSRGEGDDMVKALKALGISATDTKGKVREALPVFLDISRAFDKYEDGVTKAALAGKFFDEEGTKYIGAITKVHQQFKELNPVMDEEFVTIVQKAGQATKDLNMAFNELGAEIGKRLLPITTAITKALTEIVNLFLKIPKPIKDLIFNIALLIVSFGTIVGIVKAITLVFFAFNVVVKSITLGLGVFSGALTLIKTILPTALVTALSTAFTGLLSAIKIVAAAILANPFALLITGLMGVNPLALTFAANINKVIAALKLLLNPITAIGFAIVAIGGILYASNEDFRNWVNNIGRLIGDNLYTFIVGASTMFKQFAAEVGRELSRVGQGIADFFQNRVFPVLVNVVKGLVTMFDGFFKWIFHGFNAVAEKVIGLYNVLPEQVRNLLGQVGSFAANIIENFPLFKETRALIDFVGKAMRVGKEVRRISGLEKDRDEQGRSGITRPSIRQASPTEKKPGGGTTTRERQPTKPAKSKEEQEKEKLAAADKVLAEFEDSINSLVRSLNKILADLQVEFQQLQSTIKETLIPFKSFNKSTDNFLTQIEKGPLKFPTMAEKIKTKYIDIFNKFNIEVTKINTEIQNKINELGNKTSQEVLEFTRKYTEELKKINVEPSRVRVNGKQITDPGVRYPFEDYIESKDGTFTGAIPTQLEAIGKFKQVLELIKNIMPELQKDMEAILTPQQEQLKAAQENQAVLEDTIKFMKTGLNPEQAKTSALAEAEKKEREESLNALKELQKISSQALNEAMLLGADEESIETLENNLATLQKYIDNWTNINFLIDSGKNKTKELEKQTEQLAQTQERNKQIATEVASAIGGGLGDVFELLFTQTENWGQALLDISANVLKQIANQLFQIMVIAPIVKSLTNTFSGWLGGIRFAEGGIMTDRGPVPLKKYAAGGIATSPQLALFGEGRMPEAYVPLPDGRRIPVAMQGGGGGGGNISVSVNVDASGSQVSGSPSQGDQLGRAIASAVQSELVKQKRPGGLLYA